MTTELDLRALTQSFLDEIEVWSRADETILPCDHCGAPAETRHILCVWVRSHVALDNIPVPARVNSGRWWTFCSDPCRRAWYALPADEDFHPLECVHGFFSYDRLLRAGAWHVEWAEGELHAALVDEHLADTGEELNRWWRGETESRAADSRKD